MKAEPSTTVVLLSFFRKNWFQLAIVSLLFYAWAKKDLSFSVSVSPDASGEQVSRKPREKITENAPLAQSGAVSKLDIPFLGGSVSAGNAMQELASVSDAEKQAYLKRFVKVAFSEQKKFGIPASVLLGVALHHSFAGKRDAARSANNHFALPCTSDWNGECTDFQGVSLRRYESAWASYRDFSLFLNAQFPSLKSENYKGWAVGLERAGFSEEDNFGRNLVQIIEQFGLAELDR